MGVQGRIPQQIVTSACHGLGDNDEAVRRTHRYINTV